MPLKALKISSKINSKTIPTKPEALKLHKKYAWDNQVRRYVVLHSEITTEIAFWCVKKKNLQIDKPRLRAACLLHDIGSYIFLASHTEQRRVYPQHALFGAMLLQEEGVDEQICEMVKTHVLLGLTKAEIKEHKLALPHKSFEPQSLEARLLCYADRFSSKGDGIVLNSFNTFYANLRQNLPKQAKKFEKWSEEFGIPNIENLSKKYNIKIR